MANIPIELQEALIQEINSAEDKGPAIIGAVERMLEALHGDLIQNIVKEAHENRHAKDKGFRQLSETEKKFYTRLQAGARQAVTADQIDIIPTETIDWTLNEVKKASRIMSLINFPPAKVQRWLIASKTGAAAWGNLTDEIVAELTAAITSETMDVFKLSVFCVIPKAIRDLEIGYVDRYFTAILNEAMRDGIAAGYLDGDGKVAPIGIFRKVDETNVDGTAKAKTVVSTVTGFSPEQLAPVLQTLSHGGLRTVQNLTLVCNPLDEYQYVNPALYGDSVTGGYVQKTAIPIDVIPDANCAQGYAAFTMPGYYTMGFQGINVTEYKETMAIEDADLIIGKAYGNGRATDNDTAVIIDVTSLVPYILTVEAVANP